MTRFRRFFQQRRRRAEEEVDDEISFHLEMKARDLMESGVPEDEAFDRAGRVFGDSAAIRRECADLQRQVVRRARRADTWDSISTDVRFAFRTLRGAPGFGAVLILTLGLGIGASATVFSMLEALLVAPLPYPEQERLGFAFETRQDEGLARDRISAPLYRELADLQESFESTAIFTNQGATLTGDQPAERVGVLRSTSGFFALLGAAPAVGRLLTPEDDQDGSLSVAVLAHDLWQRRYGGDPGVVGRSITISGTPVRVVGVLSADFPQRAMRLWAGDVQIYSNLAGVPETYGIYTVLGRRAPGISWEQAGQEFGRLAESLSASRDRPFGFEVVPLAEEVTGDARPALFAMFGAATILLLITCANAATLLLSRGLEWERELALRSALGAGRGRLLLRAAVEYLVIALFGAIVALFVVLLAQGALRAGSPELGWIADRVSMGAWSTISWLREVRVDNRVLGFTALVTLTCTLLFGLVPALRVSRTDPNALLKGDGPLPYTFPVAGRMTARDLLSIGQVALAFMLLVGGTLVVRSFLAARGANLGFEPENVLTLYVNPAGERYRTREAVVGFYDEVLSNLEALPGVEAVGAVDGLPLTGGVGFVRVSATELEPESVETDWGAGTISLVRHVTPGFFATMRIRRLTGRLFEQQDGSESRRVLVVDEAFARRMWPGENPIGKQVYELFGDRCAAGCPVGEVIGVVEPVRYEPLEAEATIAFYDVLSQRGDGGHGLYAVLRTASDPAASTAAARQAVQSVDPDQPVIDIRSMSERLGDALTVRRLSALALQSFAVLALVLALAGLFGTITYGVARSRHAIAVRIALGARSRNIVGLVLRKTVLVIVTGLVIGTMGSVATGRALGSILYGVSSTDVPTYVVLLGFFLAASALAVARPLRRAAQADPVGNLLRT